MDKLFKKLIKSDSDKDSLKNKLLFKKYRIIEKLGKGSFGFVYSGLNIQDNRKIAIKFEKRGAPYHLLEKEGMFLALLKGPGIPEVLSYGKNNNYYILIQELLGENLWQILKLAKLNKYNINDLSKIAIQMIDRIEYVHSKNILHRDIKPENFLVGLDNKNSIYLIDFGISRKYRSDKTGKHIRFSLTGKLFGTLKFISYNASRGVEQSRRDDMISIGYMLAFLAGKRLPWQGYAIHGPYAKKNYEKIVDLKHKSKPEEICRGLPPEFAEYIKYCLKLNFEEKPDYEYLRNLFKQVLLKNQKDIKSEFSFINNIRMSKYKHFSSKERKGNLSTTSNDKYVNLLRRKQSPQTRLFHNIENNLKIISSDISIRKKTQDEIKDYSNHLKGIGSFISDHSNTSKDGRSHDSVKVQYNVNIDDIQNEIKLNNIQTSLLVNSNININSSSYNTNNKAEIFQKSFNDINEHKSLSFFSNNSAYNQKNNKKNFNTSIDLDKKFIFGLINYGFKKKYNSQSPIKKAKSKIQKLTKKELIEITKRRNFCKEIYKNILKKFDLNKPEKKSRISQYKMNNKNMIYLMPIKNNIKKIVPIVKNLKQNNASNIPYIPTRKNNLNQISNNVNKNYVINNNINKKNTLGNYNQKPQNIINIGIKKLVNTDIKNKMKINNLIRTNGLTDICDKGIIIIHNNINSFNNSGSANKYINIKDRNNNNYQTQNNRIKKYIYNKKDLNQIFPKNSKILRTDNYINNSRNRNHIINRIVTNDSRRMIDYVSKNNDSIYNSVFKSPDKNKSNYTNKINISHKMNINRSNDDIIKRRAIKKIRIFNYKSIFDKSGLKNNNSNNTTFQNREIKYINMEKPLEIKKKVNILRLNNYSPISTQQPIKKNITQIINPVNNNIMDRNILPHQQFLSMENNINPLILNLNNQQSYRSINNSDNIYNKINEYNSKKLIESRSNINIFEKRLIANRKKNVNHNNGNRSNDFRSFEKNRKNLYDINNNLYEPKFGYAINQYNNLYSYN